VNWRRSNWYRKPANRAEADAPVIDAINEALSSPCRRRWGFWKIHDWLRLKKRPVNHKRLWRVYKAMKLNLPRRTKKRLPARVKQPLAAPPVADRQWSMDFMEDSLYCGRKFRTLNLFDEGTREALAIEVDTSLPAARVIRVLGQLAESRSLPEQIRVDNGPEFTSATLQAWCEQRGVRLHFTQPGKPMQNGYVERFNGSFRREILDANIFGSLDEVRDFAHEWMKCYNEEHLTTRSATSLPHSSANNQPPRPSPPETLLLKCLIDGGAYTATRH
jgi:putative transposase